GARRGGAKPLCARPNLIRGRPLSPHKCPLFRPPLAFAAVQADPHRARHPAYRRWTARLPARARFLDDPTRASCSFDRYPHCAPLAASARSVVAPRPQERHVGRGRTNAQVQGGLTPSREIMETTTGIEPVYADLQSIRKTQLIK